jgi:hypothetical protein
MTEFSKNKNLNLLISIFVVLSNVLADHFFAPIGLMLTPIIIIIVACLINLNKGKFDVIIRAIISYLLIAVNDIGIKLYGGGIHDAEGQGWIYMLLLVGLVPCVIILFISGFKNQKDNFYKTIFALSLFLALIFLHLYFFENLGIGRYYKIYNN